MERERAHKGELTQFKHQTSKKITEVKKNEFVWWGNRRRLRWFRRPRKGSQACSCASFSLCFQAPASVCLLLLLENSNLTPSLPIGCFPTSPTLPTISSLLLTLLKVSHIPYYLEPTGFAGKAVAPSENEEDYDYEDFDNEDEVKLTPYSLRTPPTSSSTLSTRRPKTSPSSTKMSRLSRRVSLTSPLPHREQALERPETKTTSKPARVETTSERLPPVSSLSSPLPVSPLWYQLQLCSRASLV